MVAVANEVEVAYERRRQQAHDVREHRDLVVRTPRLLGDRRATDERPPLEDHDALAGAGEVRRRDEAVVTATDDDCIELVPIRHGARGYGAARRRKGSDARSPGHGRADLVARAESLPCLADTLGRRDRRQHPDRRHSSRDGRGGTPARHPRVSGVRRPCVHDHRAARGQGSASSAQGAPADPAEGASGAAPPGRGEQGVVRSGPPRAGDRRVARWEGGRAARRRAPPDRDRRRRDLQPEAREPHRGDLRLRDRRLVLALPVARCRRVGDRAARARARA